MRIQIVAASLFLSAVLPSLAMSAMNIKPEHYSFFAEAVRTGGYECRSSTGGHAFGAAHMGGQLFRVYCNDDALVYRVVTGGKILCVEPWSGPQNCR